MARTIAKTCQCCGIDFWAGNNLARWCSSRCSMRAYQRRRRGVPEADHTAALVVQPEILEDPDDIPASWLAMSEPAAAPLAPFAYQGRQVRVVTDEQGEPWFVAADVCAVLGIATEQTRRLDDDEKGLRSIHTPGGPQSMTTVNEPGLYSLVLGSRKPEAKRFKRWVTHEVLPTIRRTGRYAIPTPPPTQQLTLPTPEPLIGEPPAITDLVGSLRTIAADTAEAVQFELAILNTSTTPPLVRAVAEEFHATASRLRSLGVALAAVV